MYYLVSSGCGIADWLRNQLPWGDYLGNDSPWPLKRTSLSWLVAVCPSWPGAVSPISNAFLTAWWRTQEGRKEAPFSAAATAKGGTPGTIWVRNSQHHIQLQWGLKIVTCTASLITLGEGWESYSCCHTPVLTNSCCQVTIKINGPRSDPLTEKPMGGLKGRQSLWGSSNMNCPTSSRPALTHIPFRTPIPDNTSPLKPCYQGYLLDMTAHRMGEGAGSCRRDNILGCIIFLIHLDRAKGSGYGILHISPHSLPRLLHLPLGYVWTCDFVIYKIATTIRLC